MSEDLLKINGKVTRIIFNNPTNFYTVCRFRMNDESEKEITVVGCFPHARTDILYNLYGKYVEHPRYGIQFSVERYETVLASGREAEIKYLSSMKFPGIGKKTAEKIVDALGEDAVKKIKEDPQVLDHLSLSEKQIYTIRTGIQSEDDGMEELVRFLNVHGIGVRNVVRLNKQYGRDAVRKLKENPYQAAEECDGFGFATADKIAMHLGFAEDDERRLKAMLGDTAMQMCVRRGDSYVLKDELQEAFRRRAGSVSCDFDDLQAEECARSILVREEDRVYPVTQYESEKFTARFLSEFPYSEREPADDAMLAGYLLNVEKSFGITYDTRQIEAIQSFFHHPFQIITGGPGTGKTTVVRALIKLYQLIYPDSTVICAAPTGRAAKRLGELADIQGTTIHSLLQWDLETNRFNKNEDDPIICDLLIVDEFSMVDIWLFANLLKACRNVKKICIIGDEDQLPSVGPGCVLRDLIESGKFPLIRLEHIYRQAEGSDVIELAGEIRKGRADFSHLKNDVKFIPCPPEQIKADVIGVVKKALEKNYDINDVQVLSPMYKGSCGIDVLNRALQECFNPASPGKKEIRFGYTTFREGDKILQLKNQPDDEVFNGDIGVLEEILDASQSEDHKRKAVVNFQGIYVEYDSDSLVNITLAYCISVHKAQGSEYPIVIMPFSRQHMIMLQRRLIYTGCTRARKGLVLIGDEEAFQRGIEKVENRSRRTTLQERLQKEFTVSEEDFPF